MTPRVPLLDHHCHGVVATDLDRAGFEALLNEADHASPLGTTLFDSMVGLGVRRHCAPLLDLDPLVPAEAYLARRAELGAEEVNRRMLAASGIDTFLVDTGIGAGTMSSPEELAALAGGTSYEIVRLERIAEDLLEAGTADFPGAARQRLAGARAGGAVGAKSIAAYRVGLGLPARPPSDDAVVAAAAAANPARVTDPTVSAWLAYAALDAGLPLQFHVGYGDNDVDLLECDPLRLTAFLRATQERGVPVLLLHNYPFHRNAAYLAQVFDHAFLDLGLAVHNTGALSPALVRETLELAPFGKLLFSSDAYGLAELYYLAAHFFDVALTGVLDGLVDAGEMTEDDADRIGALVARDNALRAYAL